MHERGAPHLVDPEKLLESAKRLYGDDMERLWGEVAPVPEREHHMLEGGETVEGTMREYTPGHASHHVSYLDSATGDAYVGDVAGVRLPPHELHAGAHAAAGHRRGPVDGLGRPGRGPAPRGACA